MAFIQTLKAEWKAAVQRKKWIDLEQEMSKAKEKIDMAGLPAQSKMVSPGFPTSITPTQDEEVAEFLDHL